ncbi:MAG: AtpZ/AtpI family protein [Bacteroidia bacterium]
MENPRNQKDLSKLQPIKRYNSIQRYSGMAIQMIAIILLGALGGKYLDKYFAFHFPVFTLSLTLLAVFAAIYLSVRDLLKK